MLNDPKPNRDADVVPGVYDNRPIVYDNRPIEPGERIVYHLDGIESQTDEMAGTAPSYLIMDEVREIHIALKALIAERDQLAKFKAYVHRRLDKAGVPVDPPSAHREHGCRIGGRLDALIGDRDNARKAGEAMAQACGRLVATARLMTDGSGLSNDIDLLRSLNLYDRAIAMAAKP